MLFTLTQRPTKRGWQCPLLIFYSFKQMLLLLKLLGTGVSDYISAFVKNKKVKEKWNALR